MHKEAGRLRAMPGFEDLDGPTLEARLVGRWPSGAPVSRVSEGDIVELGISKLADNYFRFDSDTPALKLINGDDIFRQARADPIGTCCPLGAHSRGASDDR